jgi:hypothetical protein
MKFKTIIPILFKQEFYRELLHVSMQQFLIQIYRDTLFHNFKISTCFRITSTMCRINTVVRPDDGLREARNM